jgi:hypothetical protein
MGCAQSWRRQIHDSPFLDGMLFSNRRPNQHPSMAVRRPNRNSHLSTPGIGLAASSLLKERTE